MPRHRSRSAGLAALLLVAGGGGAAYAQGCAPAQAAQYTVTFAATWSEETHPQDFPSNPHFSGLVGGTHDAEVAFWNVGELASAGIEQMAENGLKTPLIDEVIAAVDAGHALDVVSGGNVDPSPGSVSTTFDVTQEFPLATVVSMIAPSPDWFVGVSALPLFVDGAWVEEVVVELAPYDAGTDSGETYTAPNQDTQPPEPIAEITGYPFLNGEVVLPLGTFTFRRERATCLELCVDGLAGGQEATFAVSGGEPGRPVVVLWSPSEGVLQTQIGSWCVDFAIEVPPASPASRVVVQGRLDDTGRLQATRAVDPALAGRELRFQAALEGTCPEACMSNVVTATVE